MKYRLPFIAGVLVLGLCSLSGQAPSTSDPNPSASPLVADAVTGDTDGNGLSGTYRSISLGMGMEEVKKALSADPLFGYRGDRDVSLLPTMNRTLIETSGYSFIKRSWFQFRDDALYVMIFSLDPQKIDYYSVYKGMVGKYGEPTSLDPRKASWGDGTVTLSLERPLTVKYLDDATFADIIGSSDSNKAASDVLREEFANGF